ncbi:MAG: hypothetical protein GXW99_11735 [Clostridiales bacterium]|nr:hypothetical protein [Clostridiales bacterium]
MYHGNHESGQTQSGHHKKAATLLFSLLLIATIAITGTAAFLAIRAAGEVRNTFTPATVKCNVTEEFDGIIKKNANVTNTGSTNAYIRVKLVTYRVNDKDQHIGGIAEVQDFTPGTNWVEYNGYYYYTLPVAPGEQPKDDLIGSTGIQLEDKYTDADGGKQVIEVMAEAIQSAPARAAGEAWHVTISENSVTPYQ